MPIQGRAEPWIQIVRPYIAVDIKGWSIVHDHPTALF